MTYRRGPERIKVKAGKKYAAIGAMVLTAACSAEIQATPTAEIFPTQPQATEIVPTPSPVDRIGDEMVELSAQTIITPEAETPELALIGTHLIELKDIPSELLAPLSPEAISSFRFVDENNNLLPYGYEFNRVELSGINFRSERHLRWRGLIPNPSNYVNVNAEIGVFDIPMGEGNGQLAGQIENDDRQVILILLPNQTNGVRTYFIHGRNIGTYDENIRSYADVLNSLKSLPEGASVIVGLQFLFDDKWDEFYIAEEKKILNALETKNPVSSPIIFTLSSAGIDSSYLNR